jgi:hypothetical protein
MSADMPQGGRSAEESQAAPASSSRPLRMRTNTAEIDSTIIHPGSVKINVKGAFIVDQESGSPPSTAANGATYDTKDIRLPFHTAVVSHIAVDVRPQLAPAPSPLLLTIYTRLEGRWLSLCSSPGNRTPANPAGASTS